MDFTRYLINDVNFGEIMDYIANKNIYQKNEALFEKAFDTTVNKYNRLYFP